MNFAASRSRAVQPDLLPCAYLRKHLQVLSPLQALRSASHPALRQAMQMPNSGSRLALHWWVAVRGVTGYAYGARAAEQYPDQLRLA